jgi:hypothetical protein
MNLLPHRHILRPNSVNVADLQPRLKGLEHVGEVIAGVRNHTASLSWYSLYIRPKIGDQRIRRKAVLACHSNESFLTFSSFARLHSNNL